MTDQTWQWAQLSDEQLQWLKQAEQTLGADVLLAFQGAGAAARPGVPNLQAAALNESQMDCLRGTETKLNAVVVAYQRAH
jgi:hypothetical protein